MAWTCSSVTNDGLIKKLQEASILSNPAILEALRCVDRRWFVPDHLKAEAYSDKPLPIGYGATISAPHMHVMMLELLAPCITRVGGGDAPRTVLDVGSGSGFLTAVLACLSGKGSRVIGVEHVDDLQKRALKTVRKYFPDWGEDRITFITGDGRNPLVLFNEDILFDVIHVGAAALSVPQAYLDSLRPGGCLVIPVGEENATQSLRVYKKGTDGQISMRTHGSVVFVPLTSIEHQRTRS